MGMHWGTVEGMCLFRLGGRKGATGQAAEEPQMSEQQRPLALARLSGVLIPPLCALAKSRLLAEPPPGQ